MSREIVLESEAGMHVAKVHILPFPKPLPRVVMWGQRLFHIFDEDGVYRECHWAATVPSPEDYKTMSEGKPARIGPPPRDGSFNVGLDEVKDTPENREVMVHRALEQEGGEVRYAGHCVVRVEIDFSLWDRIKILFGKLTRITVRTNLEFSPGRSKPDFTHVYVDPFIKPKPEVWGEGATMKSYSPTHESKK